MIVLEILKLRGSRSATALRPARRGAVGGGGRCRACRRARDGTFETVDPETGTVEVVDPETGEFGTSLPAEARTPREGQSDFERPAQAPAHPGPPSMRHRISRPPTRVGSALPARADDPSQVRLTFLPDPGCYFFKTPTRAPRQGGRRRRDGLRRPARRPRGAAPASAGRARRARHGSAVGSSAGGAGERSRVHARSRRQRGAVRKPGRDLASLPRSRGSGACPARVHRGRPADAGYAVLAVAWLAQKADTGGQRSGSPPGRWPRASARTPSACSRAPRWSALWIVTLAILLVGLLGSREDGLAAAVLAAVLVTISLAGEALYRAFGPEEAA